jgi:hypothetical protein
MSRSVTSVLRQPKSPSLVIALCAVLTAVVIAEGKPAESPAPSYY